MSPMKALEDTNRYYGHHFLFEEQQGTHICTQIGPLSPFSPMDGALYPEARYVSLFN